MLDLRPAAGGLSWSVHRLRKEKPFVVISCTVGVLNSRNLSCRRVDELCDFLLPLGAGVLCMQGGRMLGSDFDTSVVVSVIRTRATPSLVLVWHFQLVAGC